MYSREIDGKILTLAPTGWTYGTNDMNSIFVLMDKETESLWFPIEIDGKEGLIGIGGKYADRMLPRIQETCMLQLKWSDWKADNPNTKFVPD